ncbi:MAG: hypothetical protein D3916_01850 [Candidatus Electrothrix sp. MAN1_4]|nr:hypothetical protein [Candidatus Electrothrix sp. MAN1_4]
MQCLQKVTTEVTGLEAVEVTHCAIFGKGIVHILSNIELLDNTSFGKKAAEIYAQNCALFLTKMKFSLKKKLKKNRMPFYYQKELLSNNQ